MSKKTYPIIRFSKAIEDYQTGSIAELKPISKPRYPSKESRASSQFLKILALISLILSLTIFPFSLQAGLFFGLNTIFLGLGKIRIDAEARSKWEKDLKIYQNNLRTYKHSIISSKKLTDHLNTEQKKGQFYKKTNSGNRSRYQ